ncbi:PREDICTED: uncharacterized protein LOC104494143 [Buceros rhinoceros silvestris]|uniref:uncharacterized protein LOC104494143 n=1 Tax=Buceros rhinoceros silvestris TaxID=175836 RepID=UPI0005284C54|nr:PREDICTED: uncharacterized protein LOC104494143 [Buceros rhinoceros silvestris]
MMNVSPENEKPQLPAEMEDLHSAVTAINYIRVLNTVLLPRSGASSYFLPLKETPRLQNRTTYALIDEMICLLEAEKETLNNERCAHNNAEKFILELKKIRSCKCMEIVGQDMKILEVKCPILKKTSSNDKKCSDNKNTDFSQFKESLEEFLKWLNHKQACHNIARTLKLCWVMMNFNVNLTIETLRVHVLPLWSQQMFPAYSISTVYGEI